MRPLRGSPARRLDARLGGAPRTRLPEGEAVGAPGGRLGREETVELAEGSVLDDLMDAVIREHPRLEPIRKSAMISLNQDYAEGGAALSGGDEVALIPPVSGGC